VELRRKVSIQLTEAGSLWKCTCRYLKGGLRAAERLQDSGWSRVLCCSKAPTSLKGKKPQPTSLAAVAFPQDTSCYS